MEGNYMKKTTVLTIILALIWCMIIVLATLSPLAPVSYTHLDVYKRQVVLSAAMITAVTTFGVSLMNYMAEVAASKYGDWQVARCV